jgi:adenylate cyclase
VISGEGLPPPAADEAERPSHRISASQLAQRAACTEENVRRLAAAGVLLEDGEGSFSHGDEHRVRLAHAFEGAGVPLPALAAAIRSGTISFAYYDQLHARGGEPSDRTWARIREDLGPRAGLLERLMADLGLPLPEPDGHLRKDEEQLLLEVLGVVERIEQRDLPLRLTRLLGESGRRIADAALDVYALAVEEARGQDGLPDRESYQRHLAPWADLARAAPDLAGWLVARQLSAAIDAYSVAATEQVLEEAGFVPPRPERQPAVAFLDLTGFTWLAERKGDAAAAGAATTLGTLAGEVAPAHEGRLVKLLGDGVLMRYGMAEAAIEACLELLRRLPQAGLPDGHVGIDAGPLVTREGDIFGRTVNRASRLADHAGPGDILVTEKVVAELPEGRYELETRGELELRGVARTVAVFRVAAPADPA